MKLRVITIISGFGLGLLLSGFLATAPANEIGESYKTATIKRGGQLYDNWVKASDQNPPAGVQPLFVDDGQTAAEETWNCSKCHGYDYTAVTGAEKKTVAGAKDKPASDVYAMIEGTGTQHNFGKFLSQRELLSLTRFIKEGTYDFASVIDSNGKITGSAGRGENTFVSRCAPCHASEGKRYDFDREKEGIQGLGYLANQEPLRAFHRTLWGKPGTGMPSGIIDFEKTFEEIVDVLTYAQSLEE